MARRLYLALAAGAVMGAAGLFLLLTPDGEELLQEANVRLGKRTTCDRAQQPIEIIANLFTPNNRHYYRTARERKRHRYYLTISRATCREPTGSYRRYPAAPSKTWRACGHVQ